MFDRLIVINPCYKSKKNYIHIMVIKANEIKCFPIYMLRTNYQAGQSVICPGQIDDCLYGSQIIDNQ